MVYVLFFKLLLYYKPYIVCGAYVKIYDQHGAGHLNFDVRSWTLVGRSIVVQV